MDEAPTEDGMNGTRHADGEGEDEEMEEVGLEGRGVVREIDEDYDA